MIREIVSKRLNLVYFTILQSWTLADTVIYKVVTSLFTFTSTLLSILYKYCLCISYNYLFNFKIKN